MSDPSCRTFRELLGVYVVGAIEPGERAEVDAHLNQCYECRAELAGLAPLTAMLHRVPVEEAGRIALGEAEDLHDEPSAGMLDSLLRQVGSRRRARRFRAMFAAAAAVLIAAGGAAAVSHSLAPHQQQVDVSTASRGVLSATVRYGKTNWGITMSVQVTGFREWTTCKFWVLTKSGRKELAGGWTVGPGADRLWYPVDTGVPEYAVSGFLITWGHGTQLQIPAE